MSTIISGNSDFVSSASRSSQVASNILDPQKLSKYLFATPGFSNWRNTRISEARDYLFQIETGVKNVLTDPNFEAHFLPLCETTRLFWSRIHSAGLGRRVPIEARRATERFIESILKLEQNKDELLPHWEGQELAWATSYFHSMRRRRQFVESLLRGDLERLHEDMLEASSGIDVEFGFRDLLSADGSDSIGRILLCGACRTLSDKLLSWDTELECEAGPHARSISDHRELCVGLLDLYSLILNAAKMAAAEEPEQDDELDRFLEIAIQLRDDLRKDVRLELNRRWKQIGLSIPASGLAHPLDEETRAYLQDPTPSSAAAPYLRPAIVEFSNRASDLWKEIHKTLTAEAWGSWFSFRLSKNEPENSLMGLERIVENQNLSASDRNAALAMVFDLNIECGLEFACDAFSQPEVEAEGFFELQLCGAISKRILNSPDCSQNPRIAERIHKLIEVVKKQPAEQFGSQIKKNGIQSEFMAIFAYASSDDPDGLIQFRELLEELGKDAGAGVDRQLFFQGFLDRAFPFLQERDWKLWQIRKVISHEDVRWPSDVVFNALAISKKLAEVAMISQDPDYERSGSGCAPSH